MRTIIGIIAGLSFGIAGVSPAFAWHLTPESSNFTGKGKTSATKSGITLACKAKFEGNVDSSGVGSVTGGSFSGQLGCSGVTLGNLPWTSTAASKSTVVIQNVTFQSIIGNCGPSNITVKLARGIISFKNVQLAGGCTASGKITTSPPLAIASGD